MTKYEEALIETIRIHAERIQHLELGLYKIMTWIFHNDKSNLGSVQNIAAVALDGKPFDFVGGFPLVNYDYEEPKLDRCEFYLTHHMRNGKLVLK
jgi:hypothetical protein